MKENDNLEKHFRENLKGLEAGPPDGAKGSIEKRLVEAGMLKEKSDNRGGLWIFVLLALLVATPLVIWVTKKTKHVTINAEQALATASAKNAMSGDETISIGTPQETRSNNLAQSDAQSQNIASKYKEQKNQSEAGRKKVKTKLSQALLVTKEDAERKAQNYIAKQKKNKKKLSAENSHSLTERTQKTSNAIVIDNNVGEQSNTEKADKRLNVALAAADALPTLPVTISSTPEEQAQPPSENKPEAEKEEKDTAQQPKDKPLKDSTAKSPLVKQHALINVSFDFSGGPQFNSFKYGSGAITDNPTYVNHSQQSEKTTPSFSAAFGIVVTRNHLIVEPGIRHSTISSDFSYSDTYLTTDTSQSHFDTTGQWVHVETTTPGETHYIATNKISFIEFPALAGYGFRVKKFEIEIKAGALIGYITGANTMTFSLNSGDVVKYNELSNSPYSKICWSAIGAANVLYPLGERFSVFAQPSFKYGLNSIFKDNYSVTKKIQSVNIGIGLRVRL